MTTEDIYVYIKDDSGPITGLTPTITIHRVSDRSELVSDVAMTEYKTGWYYYTYAAYTPTVQIIWDIDATNTVSDLYRYYKGYAPVDGLQMVGKLPTNYFMGSSVATDKDDEIDAIKAITDNIPADLDAEIQLIKALLQYNSVLEISYSSALQDESTLYCYNSVANKQTHDKSTGLILEMNVVLTRDGTTDLIEKIAGEDTT